MDNRLEIFLVSLGIILIGAALVFSAKLIGMSIYENRENSNEDLGEVGEIKATYCLDEEKINEPCSTLVQPVCGFGTDFNKTYDNGCSACHSNEILFWVDGEC